MQWAIGDWYNAIPWSDKQAACEKAGLNYQTTRDCGYVAEKFKMSLRNDILGYNHHKALAIQELTPEQRADLLEKASKKMPANRTL